MEHKHALPRKPLVMARGSRDSTYSNPTKHEDMYAEALM